MTNGLPDEQLLNHHLDLWSEYRQSIARSELADLPAPYGVRAGDRDGLRATVRDVDHYIEESKEADREAAIDPFYALHRELERVVPLIREDRAVAADYQAVNDRGVELVAALSNANPGLAAEVEKHWRDPNRHGDAPTKIIR